MGQQVGVICNHCQNNAGNLSPCRRRRTSNASSATMSPSRSPARGTYSLAPNSTSGQLHKDARGAPSFHLNGDGSKAAEGAAVRRPGAAAVPRGRRGSGS
eukprot:CAMPEP_0198530786 /NCGR_PEP_ID=MMETSP1462-20131121/26561_1 /TAXON_ID=1333877 /ORGANISM="Brandtodinium nutriculum, Strain RCC3387" /LENGTH=99 /DNA_ID=CAMNT_0044260663 /DNA_START=94 /DNA_END=389 /DNA_ORIENTATION=-